MFRIYRSTSPADSYGILGFEPNRRDEISQLDIKRAYYRLMRSKHFDQRSLDRIHAAYRSLNDPLARKMYNQTQYPLTGFGTFVSYLYYISIILATLLTGTPGIPAWLCLLGFAITSSCRCALAFTKGEQKRAFITLGIGLAFALFGSFVGPLIDPGAYALLAVSTAQEATCLSIGLLAFCSTITVDFVFWIKDTAIYNYERFIASDNKREAALAKEFSSTGPDVKRSDVFVHATLSRTDAANPAKPIVYAASAPQQPAIASQQAQPTPAPTSSMLARMFGGNTAPAMMLDNGSTPTPAF